MKFTQLAVNRRLSTSAIILALAVLGAYGLWRLPVDYLPSITYPLVKVTIWWRGATPEEIEKNIAEVLEREMATVDQLDSLESSAIEGMYNLDVSFSYGADVDVAHQDVLAAVARARRELPADIDEPVVFKADPTQLPVMQLAVSGDWSIVELRTWAERTLKDQLIAVPGVAGVNVVGGYEREIRVLLDPEALEKYSISLSAVLLRLAEENVDQFAGRVVTGRQEIIARTLGEYENLEDIRSIVIAGHDQSKIYLSDLATVEDSHAEERVITRLDNKPCVNLMVLKQAEANTVEVADAVQHQIDELNQTLPGGIRLAVIENQAIYVRSAVNGVRNAALQAVLLLVLIIYLFLGSFRQVGVMLLALPVTMLVNFGLMQIAGLSLNIFSLGGLVVAIGIILDNAIVVLESITRLRNQQPENSANSHAVSGTSEVGPAIVAATLTFLALFLPFLLVPGLTSLLFRELILVMAGIVVVSLVLAISFVPMLTAAFYSKGAKQASQSRFERFYDRLADKYGQLLEGVLRWRWITAGSFVVVFVLALALLGRMGGEFLPPIDDGRLMVKVRMPTGTAVTQTESALAWVENQLEDDPLIASRFLLAGGQVRGLNTFEIANEGELDIQLVPRAQREMSTSEYVAALRPIISKIPIPGAKAMASQMRIRGVHGLSQADIQIKLRGQESGTLLELAGVTTSLMNEIAAFTNVDISMDMTKPEYHVRVDRVKAAELGVSVAAVAEALRAMISGAVPTRFLDNGEYYDIRVMVPENEIVSMVGIENLPLATAHGGTIRLRDLAWVEQATGPVEIVRENQVKQVIVQADVTGTSVARARDQLSTALAGISFPVGYGYAFGGQAELMEDLKSAVIAVLLFAVFFAFIVLAVQFNSLKLPALILGSVPLSLAGAFLLLVVTGIPFGATVIIGLLVVVAATVNDGVLLYTLAGDLQTQDGRSPTQAINDSARIRLRPRIMTTLTTMAGFIPLALNLEEGGDMLQPMAIAAIGGLSMELLVAMLFMPCLYTLFVKK